MVESTVNGVGIESGESDREVSSIDAKRNKIKFRRANATDTTDAFGNRSATESRPRRQRSPANKTQVTIGDSRPEDAKTVKGKPPKELEEESEEPKRRGRPPVKRKFPTHEDSTNTARFLLSAVEIAAVTATGPTGEMTEWERGILQAPLQRIIARTPIGVVEKGGLFIDIGFLTVGFGVYLTRISRGMKSPDWLSKKKPKVDTQEDTAAPISARPDTVVNTVKPGDLDGLAVPIPTQISAIMNGSI
jgi:hypothetical protein